MTLSFLFLGHFSFCGFELFSAVWVSLDFCGIAFFKWILGFVLSSWGLFFPFPSKVVGWRGLTFIVGERIEILWNGGLRSVYIRVCLKRLIITSKLAYEPAIFPTHFRLILSWMLQNYKCWPSKIFGKLYKLILFCLFNKYDDPYVVDLLFTSSHCGKCYRLSHVITSARVSI